MHIRSFSILLCTLFIGAMASIAAAQSVELRLNDGTRWRGEVGQQVKLVVRENRSQVEYVGELIATGNGWIQIKTKIIGELRARTIANGDIISIEAVTTAPAQTEQKEVSRSSTNAGSTTKNATSNDDGFKGVFYLPWKGGVGMEARHHEIKAIIEEADKHGRGQIIILDIDSPGGSVAEMQKIAETIQDGNKRHRIIAWIRQAISAGAATAANCHEIYFATEGALGAITMHSGGQSVGERLQNRNAQFIGEWFEKAGRPAIIAHTMILADRELSYDKDPETGRVTWHPDLSGQYILSRKGENLVFNSQNAIHSNFAQGVADTYEDLAKLLNFPEWREVNDVGRRIHESWMRTVEDAQEKIRLAEFRYANPQGRDAIAQLGYQKRQLEEMIKWYERIDVPRENLEGLRRMIREIEKQIADLNRRR